MSRTTNGSTAHATHDTADATRLATSADSISLGVLNLLPVPLLDGGHLLYYLAELIKGSPVSDRAFAVGQRIGMAVLAMLMVLALVNDVSRLF
jgi:regulator of sigma E protease